MMDKRKDKRKDIRKEEENKTVIELRERGDNSGYKTTINALTQNISLSGVRLQSDSSFPIGTQISLKITLSKSSKLLKLNGEVKWIKDIQGGELYEMGIEFMDTLPHKAMVLLHHLFGKKNK